MEGFVLLTNDEIDNIKALLSIIKDVSDVEDKDDIFPTDVDPVRNKVQQLMGTLKNINGLATDLLTML